jgi:CBS domain containing-hemolysin-like protein
MNRNFIHLEYPTSHPGVARAEQAVANFKRMGETFSPTRTLATLLLAAVVAAFVVVADQMMDTWADGHLLAAWVALWAVAFAAVGLFAGASKTWAFQIKNGLDAWSANIAKNRSDARMWAIAQTDSRLMADLHSAMGRDEGESLIDSNATQRRVSRILRKRQFYV